MAQRVLSLVEGWMLKQVQHDGILKTVRRRNGRGSLRGRLAYWSRKLRIFRERDGCFSLRSAFASI